MFKFVKSLLNQENSFSSFYYRLWFMKQLITACYERSSLVFNCRYYTSNEYIRNLLKIPALPVGLLKYLFPLRFSKSKREGLLFVLIAKNEAPYIKEWIDFHLKQGATHFVIYDNESTDNFYDVLRPYIESEIVTYEKISGKKRQVDVYNMAFKKYRNRFKYMAVLDADEFVYVRENRGGTLYQFIDDFMNTHKNAGGIAINWLIFGSAGFEKKPEGGVLENYTMCAEKDFSRNHFVKTICDPSKLLGWGNPHNPIYYRGFYNLDENGNIANYTRTEHVNYEKIRINHYFTKSKEEYIQKKNRGMADNLLIRTMEDFYIHDQNVLKDTEILSHI